MSAADDLRDLRERLEKAANTLALSYEDATTHAEQVRLSGKREGVLLALDYLRPVLAAYDATAGETDPDRLLRALWGHLDKRHYDSGNWNYSADYLPTELADEIDAFVAAGGATPDPTERVWRCALRAANDWDDCCTAHDRHRPDFGCGWVPSEEGTTPR